MYSFFLINPNTGEKWEIPFSTINFSEELNVGVNGTIAVDYFALNKYARTLNTTPDVILSGSLREWQLYKDSSLLFSGVLLQNQISGSGKQATSFNLTFTDWIGALERRATGNAETWAFTDEDSGDIAWSIINQTQSKVFGDLGITRGTHPITKDRQKTFRFDNIRDEIVKMSNKEVKDGYDFEITNEKIFNIYYPNKGELKANLILDSFNIVSWSLSKSLSGNLANNVTAVGQGNEDAIISATVENTDSQLVWGLQEEILSAKDNSQISTLTDKADKLLLDKQTPKSKVSVTVNDTNPSIFEYSVGDTLRTKIDVVNFDENLRVLRRSFQIQPSGYAIVDLSFDYE